MRLVLFDKESCEAITVVEVRSLTDRAIEDMGRRVRLVVPTTIQSTLSTPPTSLVGIQTVDIEFSQLAYGRARGWICFTDAAELAMKLDPAWLPGQLPAVQRIQKDADALVALFARALSRE